MCNVRAHIKRRITVHLVHAQVSSTKVAHKHTHTRTRTQSNRSESTLCNRKLNPARWLNHLWCVGHTHCITAERNYIVYHVKWNAHIFAANLWHAHTHVLVGTARVPKLCISIISYAPGTPITRVQCCISDAKAQLSPHPWHGSNLEYIAVA